MITDVTILPIEEASFCVLDVETTGLSPRRNNIIEIGLVKVSNLKIVDRFQSMVNPGREIPYYITNLTGITTDEIFDAPFFEDIAEKVQNFIGTDILTAHNLSFDKSFLKRELIFSGKEYLTNFNLCTLRIARRLYPMLKKRSLTYICHYLGIHNPNAHRALGDAEVTAKALIKMLDDLKRIENIKTVGELINYQYIPHLQKEKKIKKKLAEDVSGLPDAPGIYYFLNGKGDTIYIGKAKSLRSRVKSYFSPTAPRKAKKIIQQASRLKIEITNSELTALLSEAETIKIKSPKHNYQLKKYGSKYFLRIRRSHQYPVIEITNHFDFDGNDYFGLFISRQKAVSIYEMLTKTFAVRECSDQEFDKHKNCFLSEIERCTAPCIGDEHNLYEKELEKVYEFLYGKNQFALTRLINKMKLYSSQLKFEKAAEVKEVIDLILAQTHKSSLLSEPVNSANVLFEISESLQKDYILMLSGKIYIKKYSFKENDDFEIALEDYFSRTIFTNVLPDEEDLEKMKITLNWLIKNRNKVRVFYLKDYLSKQELYSNLSKFSYNSAPPPVADFDIAVFMKEKLEYAEG